MSVYECRGDLFDHENWEMTHENRMVAFLGKPDAIGHGVNCYGAMGSGIAVAFRKTFPEMYDKYRLMCEEGFLKPGMVYPWLDRTIYDGENLWVFNIASQFRPGPDAHLSYLEAGLLYARFYMRERGLHYLALPRIGAGIGGLDYDDVLACVKSVFDDEKDMDVVLVEWKQT